MHAGARRCRLVALLQVAVALGIIATRAQGQLVDIRPCQNYQSAKNFNRDYVAKLVTEDEGYSLLLTSQQPGARSCERLVLRLNGTFMFSYSDSNGVPLNNTGRFAVKEASFTHPGHIDLDLPAGVFGAPLFNNLRLFVIVAEEHYLVVTSCQAIGLISVERVHVFVSTSQLNVTTATSLNTSLAEMKVPHIDLLREVSQNCSTDVRTAAETNGSAFSQFFSSGAPLTQFLRRVSNPNQWMLPLLLQGRHAAYGNVLPSVEGRHAVNGIVLPSDTRQRQQSYPHTAAEYLVPDFYEQNFISSAPNYRQTLPSDLEYLPSVVNYHPLLLNIPTSAVNHRPLAMGYPSSAFNY